jgi:NAD(P)H-flavin reductase
VAGGTGLAPLRAVLQQIERGWRSTGYGPRVHLFHGSRMPWNLYDHEYLSGLARKPWFDYTPVVSDDPTYHGAKGLVGTVAAKVWRLVGPDRYGVRRAGDGPVYGARPRGHRRSRRIH